MSVVEWTGRTRVKALRCRRCGRRGDHVLYEIRDMETGSSGTERLCCTCGKSTFGWGAEHRFWLRERQTELLCALWTSLWLADRIVRAHSCSSTGQRDIIPGGEQAP